MQSRSSTKELKEKPLTTRKLTITRMGLLPRRLQGSKTLDMKSSPPSIKDRKIHSPKGSFTTKKMDT